MIVSQNGTSYDTSDGSQQPHEQSAEGLRRSDREQINRWEDDGPGPHARSTTPPAIPLVKPAWSVQSLTNLLEAIRALRDEPTEAVARQGRERAERSRLAAEHTLRDKAAAAVRAEQDSNRNVWETT